MSTPAARTVKLFQQPALPQVARAFAGVLEPMRREGHCLVGDFNGDGMPDVFMVVKVLLYWNGKTYVFHEDPAGP